MLSLKGCRLCEKFDFDGSTVCHPVFCISQNQKNSKTTGLVLISVMLGSIVTHKFEELSLVQKSLMIPIKLYTILIIVLLIVNDDKLNYYVTCI